MGVNDAREMLEVAKAENRRLEADLESMRRLHEAATERTVQLAAVIEQAYTVAMMQSGKAAAEMLATADTSAVLREVRAKAWEEGAHQGAEDNENGVEVMTNPYREDTDR